MKTMLKNQLELTDAMIEQEHEALLNKLDAILNSLVAEPNGAKIISKCLRTQGLSVIVNFEVGFLNTDEEHFEFGSEVSGEFSSKDNKLYINYGTCGKYSIENVYQVKRALLVADVWKNISSIETALQMFTDSVSYKYTQLCADRQSLLYEIECVEAEARKHALSELENTLKIGSIVKYDESISYSYRQFKDWVDTWRICRVCEKTIKLKADHFDTIKQLDKQMFLAAIYNGTIHIIE